MYDLPRRNLFLLAEICMPFRSPCFFLLLNPAAAAACIQHFCYAPFAPPISSVVPPSHFLFLSSCSFFQSPISSLSPSTAAFHSLSLISSSHWGM